MFSALVFMNIESNRVKLGEKIELILEISSSFSMDLKALCIGSCGGTKWSIMLILQRV